MESKIIDMYFNEKMKQIDIATKLGISKYKVSRIIAKDERSTAEKENRKIENKKKNIEYTKNYMKQKWANREQDDYAVLVNMHNQASIEMSKGKKLSNMAYRNWNVSAFSYNDKKRRYEFKEKELGKSYDVPKYIKVDI